MGYNSRQPLIQEKHTLGHIDCAACARAQNVLHLKLSGDLGFSEAFQIWLSWRSIERPDNGVGLSDASYLSPKTIKDYRACANALGKFFAKLRLNQIHAGHMREYQRARAYCDQSAGAWARPCNANRIRKEVTLLIRILRDAKLWGGEESSYFQPLRPVEIDVPRALQPEEQRRFLRCAASRTEWQFVYWYAVLALQTTASTNELRHLRLGDIMLEQDRPYLQIRAEGAKNKYRIRTIPIETEEIKFSIAQLIARARELGSCAPHHYLFPIAEAKGAYNPNFPMSDSGLKKRWNVVRAAAGLEWFRPYDTRHTGATRMAEAGVPIQVIMSFMGHMTQRMQQHYTAISMVSKSQWARHTWGDPESHYPPRKGPQPVMVNQIGNGFQQEKNSITRKGH